MITFTLDQTYKEVQLQFQGSTAYEINWSKIEVILPEEYEVERWRMGTILVEYGSYRALDVDMIKTLQQYQ